MELKDMVDIDKIFNKKVKRGEVYYVNPTGHEVGVEMKKRRPAVVISANMINENSPCIEMVYMTTKDKKPHYSTHVQTKDRKCIVLCDQITSVDKSRLGEFVRTCSRHEMEQIDNAIMSSLGLKMQDEPYVKNEEVDKVDKVDKVDTFEPGEDETLIRAAEIIREINGLGVKINEIQKLIDGENVREYSELEKILPIEKIEEIRLLTMKKINDEKLTVLDQLKEIVRRVDSRVDISCVALLGSGESGESGENTKDTCSPGSELIVEGDAELVIEKKKDVGKVQNRLSKEQLAKVKEMIIEGYDTWRIVAVVGCTNKQVYDHRRILRKKGLL